MPGMVHATNGARVIGIGLVQRSMGGAGVGLPLDPGTVITNPAGMAAIDGNMATIGITTMSGDTSVDRVTVTDQAAAFGMPNTTDKVESTTPSAGMPALGYVSEGKEIRYGLGAYGIAGGGVKYEQALFGQDAYSNLAVFRVAPAISMSFDDFVLGATLNYNMATMGFQANGLPKAKDNQQTGTGLTIGGLMSLGDDISIGFAHELKQDIQPFQYSGTGCPDGSMQTQNGCASMAELGAWMAGGDPPTFSAPGAVSGELDMDMPAVTSVGVGMTRGDFKFAYDFSLIKWSEVLGNNLPESSYPNYHYNLNWSDQTVHKLGLQYSLNDSLQLRMGYNKANDPTDHDRAFELLMMPAIIDTHYTMGGSFYFTDTIRLDFAYVTAPARSATGSDVNNFIADYKTTASMTSTEFAVTGSF